GAAIRRPSLVGDVGGAGRSRRGIHRCGWRNRSRTRRSRGCAGSVSEPSRRSRASTVAARPGSWLRDRPVDRVDELARLRIGEQSDRVAVGYLVADPDHDRLVLVITWLPDVPAARLEIALADTHQVFSFGIKAQIRSQSRSSPVLDGS